MITTGLASISGSVSGVASSVGAVVSVPLGSAMNLGNTLGIPWLDFVIGLLTPEEGNVLPTVINAFITQMTTTIMNLLGG